MFSQVAADPVLVLYELAPVITCIFFITIFLLDIIIIIGSVIHNFIHRRSKCLRAVSKIN